MSDTVVVDFAVLTNSELKSHKDSLGERFAALKAEESNMNAEMAKRVAELTGLMGTSTPVAAAKKVKRGRKKKDATEAPASSAQAAPKQLSMKEFVQKILVDNPEGLDIQGIVEVVKKAVDAGKYQTKATKLAPVVSQAVHALKHDQLIVQDKESKKYTKVA